LHKAEPHGIGHSREYDRNGGSCRFQGCGCQVVAGKEQIGLERDEFSRKSGCALGMALEISVVNYEILPLDPAVIAQALEPHFADCQILETAKQSDAASFPLCSRAPWANEQRRSNRYELAPFHSILIAP
jgi:hypothetical protein